MVELAVGSFLSGNYKMVTKLGLAVARIQWGMTGFGLVVQGVIDGKGFL